ncbi:hypothetical protein PTKIN_Ptkin14bG0075200 [Pterospermum kingtungense]
MAAEFVASTTASTVGNLATEYASSYVSYFFRYEKIVEEFKNQRKELEMKNVRVKNDVDEAIRQTEVIEKDVQDWLTRAEKELEETQSLEAEIEREKCFNWCPNWGWRYCLSKKIAKKTVNITKLLERCSFPRVGYRAPLQGMEFLPSKDFMPSHSPNSTFKEIIRSLTTNGVNMIGLYGMPGVGKTTLAKEVGKHVNERKLFDKVVIVTMSQTPVINKVQDRIAEMFGLNFKTNTEEGKAEELLLRLKEVKKMLIIIDDVWNEFKVQSIGIPFGVELNDCRILLTTRDKGVCVQMNCEEIFQLKVLSDEVAWTLFKDKADLKDVSPTLNDVAKEVASECKGLPLAIVVVGKALKGASLDEWIAANQRFKDSRHLDNEDDCEGIYNCLKLSYDYLKGDNIRSCFLLCSLFPEDFDIGSESLIMMAIGHGLFSNDNFCALRTKIGATLTKLQKSSLLLETDVGGGGRSNERYARMHDVIRDFGHWKTSRENNIFMVKEGLTEWPRENLECCTAVSFWKNNINNFPENLEFPKLKILIFERNKLVKIPSAFLERMKDLRILLIKNVILSLEVFKVVTNLRTLCCEGCELENISLLRNMENLEILALCNSNIYELPEELMALRRLKSLHFFSGRKRGNFPPNLLSRLTSLQELHVTCKNNLNLSELNSLSGLTALSLRVSTDQCFADNFVFPKLQRCIIAVNQDLPFMVGLTFRTLKITNLSSSLSAFKEMFLNVEKLTLSSVKEHKNIVPSMDHKGLNGLTSLKLRCCKDIECLMDTTGEKGSTTAFSNLVKLCIEKMDCLNELWHGPPPIRSLEKLEDVYLEDCKELKVVFPMDGLANEEISQTQLLSNLTSLVLESLPELEGIWQLQPTHRYHHHHATLQSLELVKIHHCRKLKSIFSTCVSQTLLHLQQLDIHFCEGLENVFDFSQEMAELEVPPLSNLTSLKLMLLRKLSCIWKGPTHLVNLQRLETMIIMWCPELAYLFPAALAQSLVHLEVLEVQHCVSLKHVIFEELAENEDEIVSNIDGCSLYEIKLRTLKIIDCGSLKYVFSISLAQGITTRFLQKLEDVNIQCCKSLKVAFRMDGIVGKEEIGQTRLLSNLTTLYLHSLLELESIWKLKPTNQCHASLQSLKAATIRRCNKLKSIFSTCISQSLLSLQQVDVSNCDGLEKIFDFPKEMAELEENQRPPLSNLTVLELNSLSKMRCIWEGPTHLVSLPRLKTMVIDGCLKLAYLFPITLAQTLVHLEVLDIQNCGSLEHIINEEAKNDEDEIVSNKGGNSLCWPKLKILKIRNCKSLKHLFPITLAQGLPHLESVDISDCSRLNQVFNMTKLEKGGHLQQDIALQSLQILKLTNLENLSSFCPENFVMSLSLKEFKVHNCPRLTHFANHKEVVLQAEYEDVPLYDSKGLPCNAKFLSLIRVNFHKNLIPKVDQEGLNELTFLRLKDGKELECLIDTADQAHVSTGAFLNLAELVIKKMTGFKMLCNGPFPKGFLQNLKKVRVMNCGQLQEVFRAEGMGENQAPLQSNLTVLELKSLPEVRWIWKGTSHHVCLQNLKVVEIFRCDKLKYLFSPSLAQSLVVLKKLKVEHCNGLEDIVTPELEIDDKIESEGGHLDPPFFPKLITLYIRDCPRLKYVFQTPLAQVLPELISVWIADSPQLKQVFNVAKDKIGVDHAIMLPRLRDLQLENLMNLSCFCSENYPIVSPSLVSLTVWHCPPLSNFTIQHEVNKQIQLKKLRLSEVEHDVCDTSNWKRLYQIQAGDLLSKIEVIHLNHIHQFQGPMQVASLQYLRELKVSSCNMLKSLFSPMVAGNLPQLTHLHLECCEELEEIIEMDYQTSIASSSSQSHLQPISFPSLEDIWISGCSNLKSLFPTSVTLSLSKLKSIRILSSSKLEQVFGYKGELTVEDDQKRIEFPELEELKLSKLPGLKSFAPIGYHFQFRSLINLEVGECPNLIISFGKDSKDIVHVITEVPKTFFFCLCLICFS